MQTWLKNVRMCYKVQRESSCVALRWMGVGDQRHASAALPLGKRPGIHCAEQWVGLGTGLDGYEKPKTPPGFDPEPSRPYRVAIPTALSTPIRPS
jgi:hypothetical protein